VTGALRRLTRGAGIAAYPSLSNDGRWLAFASDRGGNWDITLKDLATGTERAVAHGPDRQMYAVITPDGRRIAYGVVVSEPRIERPIYVAELSGGASRLICGDCNGRPRDWFPDGMRLVVERFARHNSVGVLEEATGVQHELLTAADRSVMDPRISPVGIGWRFLPAAVTVPRRCTLRRFLPAASSGKRRGSKSPRKGITPRGRPTAG
jgi:Tol biopolymer transport system component